jgi:hypothetical protein
MIGARLTLTIFCGNLKTSGSSMENLTSQQILRLLKNNEGWYLKHYFTGGSVYDDEGNDQGKFSQKVLDNLIAGGKIKFAGDSVEFWSHGYYTLNTQKQ